MGPPSRGQSGLLAMKLSQAHCLHMQVCYESADAGFWRTAWELHWLDAVITSRYKRPSTFGLIDMRAPEDLKPAQVGVLWRTGCSSVLEGSRELLATCIWA